MEKIKICYIATISQETGVGIYGLNLLKELPKDIIVLDWPYKTRIQRFFGPLLSFFHLWKICRKFDIIHVQYHLWEYGPLFLPILSLLKRKCKIVLTLHEMHKDRPKAIKFHDKFYDCADLLITHTKVHKKFLPNKYHERTKVIFMGIRKIPESIMKSDKKEILMPGFINQWKGHDIAIPSVEKLIKKHKLHLTIIGKANDEEYLQKIKILCKYKKWITFKERFIDDKDYDRAFRQADIILLPYRRITMSAILADAIAYHKPVIASNIPAFKEILDEIGPLAASDDIDDFSEKIDEMLRNQGLRENITGQFKEWSNIYSFKNLAKRTMAEYQLLLQSNK